MPIQPLAPSSRIFLAAANEKIRSHAEEFRDRWLKKHTDWPLDIRNTQTIIDEQLRLLKEERRNRIVLDDFDEKKNFLGNLRWGQSRWQQASRGSLDLRTDPMNSGHFLQPILIYHTFFWIYRYPEIRTYLAPYHNAKMSKLRLAPSRGFDELISILCRFFLEKSGRNNPPIFADRMWDFSIRDYRLFFRKRVSQEIVKFLQTYNESAFVMLALMQIAREGAWYVFPEIDGRDPIETVRFLKNMNTFMYEKSKLPNQAQGYFSAEAHRWFTSPWKMEFDGGQLESFDYPYNHWSWSSDGDFSYFVRQMTLNDWEQVAEIKTLKKAITDRWIEDVYHKRPEGRAWWWMNEDEAARWYVLTRACYLLFRYNGVDDDGYCDYLYPEPHHPGACSMVDAYVAIQEQLDLTEAKRRTDRLITDAREKIERKFENETLRIIDELLRNPGYPVRSEAVRSLSKTQKLDLFDKLVQGGAITFK